MAKKDKDQLRPATPQPTKRDRVIAQRQASAAEGDTTLSIANRNNIPVEDLLAANPGVVTVRPGQVLALPKPTGGGYMPSLVPQQSNPFAGSQSMVGVGAFGGGQPSLGNYTTSYNGFQTPTTNGFKAPTNLPTTQTPPVTQKQPAGYTNLTPSQAQNIPKSGMIGGDKQSALGTPAQQTAMFPTDDKGRPLPYTGNPNDPNTALWKQYWNASARAGVDLARRISTPKVMTRDQIWEMKAAQRRKQTAGADSGGSVSYDSFSYDTQVNPELVRNITWGI